MKSIQSLPTLLKALTSLRGISCKRETYDQHLRVFPSAIISWVSLMYHAVSMLVVAPLQVSSAQCTDVVFLFVLFFAMPKVTRSTNSS
jgi:hypothetical protein